MEERDEIDAILAGIPKMLLDLYPPNSEPQRQFIFSEADIAIIGGSAGGGKTVAELLEPTRDSDNPEFGAVIFRRTMKQVKDEGGIWDQSAALYSLAGAKPNLTERFWTFASGAVVQFAGLENDLSKYTWKGAQICDILFDELTEFLESQFWYLLSRNRSTCGAKIRVRGSTNPAPGWVKRLLAPWVDDSFPNPAASGELRWFIRPKNQIVWVDEPPDRGVCDKGPDREGCFLEGCLSCFPPEKSITFIRSTAYHNRDLLKTNPGYIANLMAQDDVEMRRLLLGDWNAKPANLVIDAFDESLHTVEFWEMPLRWKRWVGADFGDRNGAELAVAWNPETEQYVVFGENWPGHTRTWGAIGDDIRKICGRTPDGGSGGNCNTEQGWRQAIRREKIPMAEPSKKFSDPKIQYKCVNDAFKNGDLVVMENCPKLIEMINEFQRKVDPLTGAVLDEFDDKTFHLCSALRYIVTKLLPPKIGASRTIETKTTSEDVEPKSPTPTIVVPQLKSQVGGLFIVKR